MMSICDGLFCFKENFVIFQKCVISFIIELRKQLYQNTSDGLFNKKLSKAMLLRNIP